MGLYYDAKCIRDRDPAARNVVEVMLLYAGFHALVWHRIAHFFFRLHLFFLARLFSQLGRFFTGVEIHPGARIGRGLFIDHGMGIVIGETAEIGDDCTIYHNVTLGGTGKHVGKRHPTLKNNVLIGAGAKVLGPCVIGNNSNVGANAVVLCDVPDDSTAVGVPAHIVRRAGQNAAPAELDQIHTPDPVAEQLHDLTQRLQRLEELTRQEEARRQ